MLHDFIIPSKIESGAHGALAMTLGNSVVYLHKGGL